MTADFQAVGFLSKVIGIVNGPTRKPEELLLDGLEVGELCAIHSISLRFDCDGFRWLCLFCRLRKSANTNPLRVYEHGQQND